MAGQSITLAGVADDIQDGSVPCSQFTWMVLFHHAAQVSLVQGPQQGSCGTTFEVPLHADPTANQWYFTGYNRLVCSGILRIFNKTFSGGSIAAFNFVA